MSNQFPIIDVPLDASQDIEDLGTKEKFWFHEPTLGRCLFKKARPNTGEDWAEKIASELCDLLGLPHANYELATFNGENGIISPSFIPEEASLAEFGNIPQDEKLTLGNEILFRIVSDYPRYSKNPSQHTIDIVLNAINESTVNLPINWTPPNGITTAVETFVGYLLLDAWIGNSDRHHENWAFISVEEKIYLAPTYDHASSMGRELRDEKRNLKLNNKSCMGYVEKCSSVLYANVSDSKPLKTVEAFSEAKNRYPNAGNLWLDNLAKVSSNDTLNLFERIPSHRISQTAIEFAQKILELNQNRLLMLRNT
ncbi:HipA domain-containing protein [Sphaerospermopsis aphanizomenoides BCCUSP55]|uniref:HipA domain-containing protein n=1 Tax=Sphaerospermopsis aphanizomenoides TaxID=459663 RepID=UPI001905EC98|nr:HipA domain-containing protein [Sphaerospermopsis aphanizomenoides]MBK1988273.1 HipA domain-containing protein [Sphaerospermopsis aphanizomenoides BCCUSP55]